MGTSRSCPFSTAGVVQSDAFWALRSPLHVVTVLSSQRLKVCGCKEAVT